MNPHESTTERAGGRKRRRSHEGPLDRDWVARRGMQYAARWESTAAAVTQVLERKIRERCRETEESPADALEWIPGIVEELVARGYVDDRRYAESHLERMRKQGRSNAQMQARLRAKGIAESLVQELLEEVDSDADRQAAWRLAKRRRLGPYCLDEERRARDRDRHLAVLARQGFDRETAVGVIDAESAPEDP